MRSSWTPRPPRPAERAAAGAVAAVVGTAVGVVAFYFARLFLYRDELPLAPPKAEGAGEDR